MNENKNPLQFLVTIVQWVVDAAEMVLVGVLDGLRNATDHASPSFFGLVAVVLPFLTPAPVAYMSAQSAMEFFQWTPNMAWILAISVEGLGLIAWVATVEAFLQYANTGDQRYARIVWVFGGIAFAYEILIVTLNVGLELHAGADGLFAFVLFLICMFPAMSAFYYGHNKRLAEMRIAKKEAEAKAEAERLRIERREDRQKAQELKLKYAAEAGETLKLKPFRKSRKSRVDERETEKENQA